jgi:hypothetical protein
MDPSDVAVATMTKVRGEEAEASLLRALSKLAACGMPVSIADAGSSQAFRRRLTHLTNISLVKPRSRGLVGQIQASVAHAKSSGRPYILYTEPDKYGFFDHGLMSFVRGVKRNGRSGLVLAARSASAFATFPSFQRVTESEASALCGSITGIRTDYFYGPFLIHREFVDFVAEAPAALGWGWRPYVLRRSHDRNLGKLSLSARSA